MAEDAQQAFVRQHMAGLQVELDRLRSVLHQIETGPVRHLDNGRLHSDVLDSIAAYERSLSMWAGELRQASYLPES